jgi:tRNA-splicing ligase RtcB
MLALFCGVVRPAVGKVRFDDPISCHHNYVAEETYGGVELLVSRKGAIRAGSASSRPDGHRLQHRAGARQRRGLLLGVARRRPADVGPRPSARSRSRTSRRRRPASSAARTPGVVDEIPGAYQDVGEVIARQADLVAVVAAHLKQVLCVEG